MSLLGKLAMGLEYLCFRTGPLTMPPSQLGAFARSNPALPAADLEWHVQPLSLDKFGDPLHTFEAVTPSVCNLQPTSRGHVRIVGDDAAAAPKITLNYLATAEDRAIAVSGLRFTRRIMAAKALERKKLIAKSERPGEKRSVVLRLTAAGSELMARDPWGGLARSCAALAGKTRRRMDRGLAEVLSREISRRLAPSFGTCASCRFWRADARTEDARGPHLCMLFDEPLSAAESSQICMAHEPAGG